MYGAIRNRVGASLQGMNSFGLRRLASWRGLTCVGWRGTASSLLLTRTGLRLRGRIQRPLQSIISASLHLAFLYVWLVFRL
jgi:hypothetical protein